MRGSVRMCNAISTNKKPSSTTTVQAPRCGIVAIAIKGAITTQAATNGSALTNLLSGGSSGIVKGRRSINRLLLWPNAAHQWRAAKDARYLTETQSARLLNALGW